MGEAQVSEHRVERAHRLWRKFQRANRLASSAMVDFSTYSHQLDDDETEELAKLITQEAAEEGATRDELEELKRRSE